jgi:hypothetical protein
MHHRCSLYASRSWIPRRKRNCGNGLFRELLELNATDLVHGAYGLDGNEIVLTDTLQIGDLDFSEMQASLESILMALRSHYDTLSRFRTP